MTDGSYPPRLGGVPRTARPFPDQPPPRRPPRHPPMPPPQHTHTHTYTHTPTHTHIQLRMVPLKVRL